MMAVLLCILADVHVTSNPAEHERNLRAKEEELIRKMSQNSSDSQRAKVTVDQQATDMKAGR